MAPSKRTKPTGPPKKSTSKLSTLSLDSLPIGPKHLSSSSSSSTTIPKVSKPFTSFAKTIPPNGTGSSSHSAKGKAPMPHADGTSPPILIRETNRTDGLRNHGVADQLWVDKYVPQTEAELAVHKKKIGDVRRWLTEAFDGGSNGVLRKYRRILALTGPAGAGKTAVLQVLARELDFKIVEWQNSMDDNFSTDGIDYDRESLTKKFQTFISRASSCRTLPLRSSATSSSSLDPAGSRQIILLEDLPNVLHAGTAEAFQDALEDFIDSPPGTPFVFVVSDTGTRGEDSEADMMGSRRWVKQAIDVRSIIHPAIFNSPYFTEIQFNPIAPTLLLKALTKLLTRHFPPTSSKSRSSAQQPSKEALQIVVESAHGDIRSAIMALQFACVVQLPKGKKNSSARNILEAVTRREQSLALFHMLGKVLYNKRKGDPPNPLATAKDRERESRLDIEIPDPPALPSHLAEHSRRGSRVDVNMLYADSPIDTSLFALYLHHNYTQFCNEVDECDAVCEWLSWIDSNVGETWHAQQNPHHFHILTLGTLHGLPSPVPRRSQKMFKPEFFEVLKKGKAAAEGITDTEAWINAAIEAETEGSRRWGRDELVLEIGGVLKALDACGIGGPPSTHGLFTKLSFVHPARMPSISQRMQQLGEVEIPGVTPDDDPRTGNARAWKGLAEQPTGGWLENDDIQEF